jgi:SpoU rRNA methylase family enzyme
VRDWLHDRKKGKWVLVLDNVDDASFLLEPQNTNQGTEEGGNTSHKLFEHLPVCDHGSILVTNHG